MIAQVLLVEDGIDLINTVDFSPQPNLVAMSPLDDRDDLLRAKADNGAFVITVVCSNIADEVHRDGLPSLLVGCCL